MALPDEKIEILRQIFDKQTEHTGCKLNEEGMKRFLLDFDIDESFAPPMLRLISTSNGDIDFDQFKNFINLLFGNNIRHFMEYLFLAIDLYHDRKLMVSDLVKFGELIGDNITIKEAEEIMIP